MKILFICTAHNSLSQRLFLVLSPNHSISIEYALSEEAMIEAANMVKPDLIICPFLTVRVPRIVYDTYMTLIIHPGAPGDSGPSALDWVLMGDDGSINDAQNLLQVLQEGRSLPGRTHWGVTVLQAIEEFDAGPVWAFEQFPIDIDNPRLTKSSLYRGAITRAAITAAVAAVDRVQRASLGELTTTPPPSPGIENLCPTSMGRISPSLQARDDYYRLSVGSSMPFLGGPTHDRPLLKASQRDFDIQRHGAKEISRRIRCSDSQPGCLSKVFGPNMYVYGGIIDENVEIQGGYAKPGSIIATRNEAVCVATCDAKGIWITHLRRLKLKKDLFLWPKVPALSVLQALQIPGVVVPMPVPHSDSSEYWSKSPTQTFQEIWVQFNNYGDSKRAAYLYFDFYNGAMSTTQCSQLIEALDYILSTHTAACPLAAVILMGGSYFSNGIALNVIEAATSPSLESWLNINRINDVVYYLLHELPTRNILTIAGIRGNCAAGGVALATACDIVISGSEVTLNPAYRSIGLSGSEFHSLSYTGRCGETGAKRILRSMLPMSPNEARSIGLLDHVLPGSGSLLETRIQNHVKAIVCSKKPITASWKSNVNISTQNLALVRATELQEMAKDFYSPRSVRYHSRRRKFVRKMKPTATPLRFASHRRFGNSCIDEEESDNFDNVEWFEAKAYREQQMLLVKRVTEGLHHLVLGGSEPCNESLIMGEESTMGSVISNTELLFPCYYRP